MSEQLSFDEYRPHVGTTRPTRRPTTRDLLDRLWSLANAARRCQDCPDDVLEAVAAVDALGPVDFDPPADNGRATSRAAALRARPAAGTLRAKVLAAIRAAPDGLTDDQLEQLLGLPHQTCSARRRDLVLGGYIEAAGTRPTRTGCQATVWRTR